MKNFIFCFCITLLVAPIPFLPFLAHLAWATDIHDYYLIDPTKVELETIQDLDESIFIRSVSFLQEDKIEYIHVEDTKYCLVKFWVNTRDQDALEARRYIRSIDIPIFRTKEEALNSIGSSEIFDILDKCEEDK